MSILLDKNSRVIFQGITGKAGGFHAKQCLEYGTLVVGGVTPGKGGVMWDTTTGAVVDPLEGTNTHPLTPPSGRGNIIGAAPQTPAASGGKNLLPVFDTVAEAVKKTKADVSCIFVPPPGAADGILEAADAGIKLIIAITEGIPVRDMMEVKAKLSSSYPKTVLIGPNCPGVITPGQAKVGIMPGYIHKPGHVGILSRSGTLTYEAVWQLTQRGIGQSTCVGIGGDPIIGSTHLDIVKRFNEDPDTHAIIMIGEIGGQGEIEAADYIRKKVKKPVAAFIAGASAPKGRRMGHAGAIVSGANESAAAKIEYLTNCGIVCAATPAMMAEALLTACERAGVTVS
jgi:succinyl-CoA synthetase alpha subunit